MRIVTLTLLLLLVATPMMPAHASEHILVTSGVVRAVDSANGTIVLASGVKLRVRNIIIDDQLSDIVSIRVGDTVFVSGVVLARDGAAQTRAETRQ